MSAVATMPPRSCFDAPNAGIDTTVDPPLNPPAPCLAAVMSYDTDIQRQWTSISP